MENNKIVEKVWTLIRSGQVEEAQKLCKSSGQFWRAATIAGAQLYHNSKLCGENEKPIVVGNQNRFITLHSLMKLSEEVKYYFY